MEAFGNIGLYATYALIGLALAMIIIFGLMNIIKNPGGARSFLVGILTMLVVLGISYAVSTGTDANTLFADIEGATEGTSHLVGMGLKAFYILSGAAILSIIYAEVSRLFSK